MAHLQQDEILAFVSGRSDARAAERAYQHIDACEACAQRYEAVRAVRADFDGTWDDFVTELVSRVRTVDGAARAGVGLVIRGLFDEAERIATAAVGRIRGSLEELGGLDASFQPAYSGIGDVSDTGEAARLAQEASDAFGARRDPEALEKLRRAAGLDPRAAASASVGLRAGGRRIGEVVVDATRRAVSVLVELDRPGAAIGFVVLCPEDGRRTPRRVPLEAVEGARYFLAEFEDVPAGPFTLELEID